MTDIMLDTFPYQNCSCTSMRSEDAKPQQPGDNKSFAQRHITEFRPIALHAVHMAQCQVTSGLLQSALCQ